MKTKVEREHNVTIWVTKYAFTQGIYSVTGCDITENGYASRMNQGSDYVFLKMGTEAFRTEEEAKAHALKMAHKRIASLKDQLEKMEDYVHMGPSKVLK